MKKFYKHFTTMLLALMLGAVLFRTEMASAAPDKTVKKMQVNYLDVGQGDCALITCDGKAMLIDAGDDTKGTAIQNYLKKQKIEKLDYLILTHPDADHIGGAPVIITKFKIDKVFVSNYEKDNKTYQKLIQALDYKKLKYETPKAGAEYSLGTAKIKILAPNGTYDNPNDSSITLLLKNGNNTFLFTGDAGSDAEKDILKKNKDISADVYKAGHHGSKYATSKEFLKAVDPAYAVISCGENNSYGHPHAATLNAFRAKGIKVYRTDEDGTIIATSDGKNITFNVPPSETWKAGEPTKMAAKTPAKTGTAKKETQASAAGGQQSTAQMAEAKPETPPVTEVQPPVTVQPAEIPVETPTELTYVLNTKTKKFHYASCGSLPTTNRLDSSESRDSIVAQGYVPCKKCNP